MMRVPVKSNNNKVVMCNQHDVFGPRISRIQIVLLIDLCAGCDVNFLHIGTRFLRIQ